MVSSIQLPYNYVNIHPHFGKKKMKQSSHTFALFSKNTGSLMYSKYSFNLIPGNVFQITFGTKIGLSLTYYKGLS